MDSNISKLKKIAWGFYIEFTNIMAIMCNSNLTCIWKARARQRPQHLKDTNVPNESVGPTEITG